MSNNLVFKINFHNSLLSKALIFENNKKKNKKRLSYNGKKRKLEWQS